MIDFRYRRTASVDDALASIKAHADAKFLGGGTNLVDLMKMGVEHPSTLVDITRVPLTNIEPYGDGVRIGQTVDVVGPVRAAANQQRARAIQ